MAFMRSGVRSPSAPPSSNPVSNTADRKRKSRLRTTVAAPAFLFGATVLVVIWQNARLAVLWDLSYVLENAVRMSLGQVPYRDFPFPYPPLTFLIQARVIKLAGRVFWHHAVYCAVMSGGATVLTWRILINLFCETPHARLLAFS